MSLAKPRGPQGTKRWAQVAAETRIKGQGSLPGAQGGSYRRVSVVELWELPAGVEFVKLWRFSSDSCTGRSCFSLWFIRWVTSKEGSQIFFSRKKIPYLLKCFKNVISKNLWPSSHLKSNWMLLSDAFGVTFVTSQKQHLFIKYFLLKMKGYVESFNVLFN